MQCNKCRHKDTQVTRSVKITGSSQVIRYRKCRKCGHTFQTSEAPNSEEQGGK
jgi:transcriptional regulator NrdR family protein